MRCCLIFLDFLLVPTITSTLFSLILVMGDIAVDMFQGDLGFVCASFVCYFHRSVLKYILVAKKWHFAASALWKCLYVRTTWNTFSIITWRDNLYVLNNVTHWNIFYLSCELWFLWWYPPRSWYVPRLVKICGASSGDNFCIYIFNYLGNSICMLHLCFWLISYLLFRSRSRLCPITKQVLMVPNTRAEQGQKTGFFLSVWTCIIM